ncbi:MAG: SufD family Fe-S cluster assembly protein [Solobacterium sp.]|nr:SufD family Fe-S cluster assembly protein [Solobacterium sp.]
MEVLKQSGILNIQEGFQEYTIDTEGKLHLSFHSFKNAQVFFHIKNANEIIVEGKVEKDTHCSIFFYNDAHSHIEIKEDYAVDGELHITFSECNLASSIHDLRVHLNREYAKAKVNSASLVNVKKNYHIEVINHAAKTEGLIQNYAVVLAEGNLMIDAIGKIERGAKKSQSHQTSRALSFAEGQKATILPELLIDENDVQASHAMSMGKVDDEQLYYMMSRGLSMEDCTSLISKGYLLPILDEIEEDELSDKLKDEIERKIAELCLM